MLLLTIQIAISQNKLNAFAGANYSYFTDGVAGQILAEESFGLNLGISYEIPCGGKINFRPGIVFNQMGDRTETSFNSSSNDIDQLDIKLSYLSIPMDFKVWNKIYLFAGPQIGFLVSKQSADNDSALLDSSIDFGFNLGTGFTIDRVFVEFAIYQGLTSLAQFEYFPTETTTNIHNGYARVSVGYQIK